MNPWLSKNINSAKRYLNLYSLDELPSVDLLVLTYRTKIIDRIKENINNQVVKPNRVIVVTDRYTPEDVDKLQGITNCNELIIISDVPTEVILGERNNIAFQHSVSEYVAMFDDDDIYYPYYLKSQLSYLKECGKPAGISKVNPVGRDESCNMCGFVLRTYRNDLARAGAGGSIVLHRSIVEKYGFEKIRCGYDSIILHKTKLDPDFELLSSDPFNFIVTRGRPEGHTWRLPKSGIYWNNVIPKELDLRGE